MSGYVYGRSPASKRPVVPDDARNEWAEYQAKNRLANLTYEQESPLVDYRYNPSGGKFPTNGA